MMFKLFSRQIIQVYILSSHGIGPHSSQNMPQIYNQYFTSATFFIKKCSTVYNF